MAATGPTTAATELDMSLDDIIKAKKGGARGGRGGRGTAARGGAGGRGAGPVRRNNRPAYRANPYAAAKPTAMVTDGAWQHDLFENGAAVPAAAAAAAGGRMLETGTKLYISNLDFGVSNEDIKELFSEIGDLKRCAVHYDRSGRSKGTAEVVFARRSDAAAAVSRYNNVQLDGKPMRIEIIGTNLPVGGAAARLGAPVVPAGAVPRVVPAMPLQALQLQTAPFRGGGVRRGGGAARGRGRGRGRGGGRGRGDQPQKTQEELDAELDSYHAQKDMET